MYSKLAIGLAMAGAASAAQIVKRDGGAHAHGGGGDHGHGGGGGGHAAAAAPSDGYGAPAASYGAPAQSYGAPAQSYGAPAPSYGAPATGYGQEASYGGYEEEGGFDLTAIILPLLILLGLSLLFPGIVSVTVRKKREAMEEAANPLSDVIERVNDIYGAVVESEECLQRIACEIGGIAGDVGLKQTAKLADPFVPSKYKAYYKQFTTGQNCHKIKCGTIF